MFDAYLTSLLVLINAAARLSFFQSTYRGRELAYSGSLRPAIYHLRLQWGVKSFHPP